ncbi:MAG: DMT family transporter [Nostocoides sp.]
MSAFALLLLAIIIEVASSATLPRSEGFTNPGWTIAVAGGYLTSIWLLTVVVQRVDVSIAYAIWSGVGTAAIAVIGYLWLGEPLGVAKLAGIGLIIVGVVLLNLQSGAHTPQPSQARPSAELRGDQVPRGGATWPN